MRYNPVGKIVRSFARSLIAGAAALVFILCGWAGNAKAGQRQDVFRATLENGLRVVIVRNTLAPVVTTEINYLVGADEDPEGFPGAAHAHEHMMFRGSPGLSEDQLSAIISDLGGQFNADTQQTITQYFMTTPASDLEIPLRVEALRMRAILATRALWGQERGAIEQEVAQDLSDPEYVFYKRLLAHIYAGTPYSHDPLGTFASFNGLTARMIRKFHRQWYSPNNAILVIVGDVDPKAAFKTVKKIFGPVPSRPTPKRPAVRLKPLRAASIRMETDLPYGVAVVAYRLPGFGSPGFAAGQILSDVLSSKRAGLYALVPGGQALSAEFDIDQLPEAGIGYAMATFAKGADGPALVAAVKKVVADYLKTGFPADLVEAAKRRELAHAEFGKNSVPGLASLWSETLAVEGRNSPDDDIAAIKKVTAEDVDRVARQYLINDTAITAVLVPAPPGKVIRGPKGRSMESFISKPRHGEVKLPGWAAKAGALPAPFAGTVHPATTTFANGLRLIVQPESISNTVSIYGQVKNDPYVQEPKGKDGVSQVLNGLFHYGAGKLGRLAFQKALDDIAADESGGASFSLEILANYFDRGAQLLAQNLLQPAIREKPFNAVRKQTVGSLQGLLQSPTYLATRSLRAGLYPEGDPKLREATPGTAEALKLDDVRSYFKNSFRPDLTTIVVIGRVTPEQAKSVIGRYFGGWKATGPRPETDLPPVPPNKPSYSVVPDPSRVQDNVTLAQTLGITRKSPDYYALELGTRVLAGGFYASRLYRDLRELTGLVYSVGAQVEAGRTRSAFLVAYACDPKKVSTARAIIERDIKQMRSAPVTKGELIRNKALVLRRLQLSESSVRSIGQTLLGFSVNGLPLNETELADGRYRRMTAADVQSAFMKWIRPDDFVQVTLGPTPQ
ncbi:MAG: pitrilysin family protein [Nitrospiraceae bacterium]|nr:pitrilysin family protein [Nitrospiraceae bacterium]